MKNMQVPIPYRFRFLGKGAKLTISEDGRSFRVSDAGRRWKVALWACLVIALLFFGIPMLQDGSFGFGYFVDPVVYFFMALFIAYGCQASVIEGDSQGVRVYRLAPVWRWRSKVWELTPENVVEVRSQDFLSGDRHSEDTETLNCLWAEVREGEKVTRILLIEERAESLGAVVHPTIFKLQELLKARGIE